MRDSSGAIVGAVLVARDVTELTELERLKEEFLRAMAHELKTPLTVVSGYFEMFKLLRKKQADEIQLNDCMERMGRGLVQLKSLVVTLVDTAAFRLGKLKLKYEAFDLKALVKELADSLAITTSMHRLDFAVASDDGIEVRGDRVRLGQVLTNLLQNAIKYSPHGGVIEIAIREEDHAVIVSVKDHGIGIPLDRQERVFQRFYRAHAESEHDYGGMGVGLFLSHEIIQAHQGKIWFSSQVGLGSTFSFSLPK